MRKVRISSSIFHYASIFSLELNLDDSAHGDVGPANFLKPWFNSYSQRYGSYTAAMMGICRSRLAIIAINAKLLWAIAETAGTKTTDDTNEPTGAHNSDPSVHCSKTRWYHVLFFYLSN